MTKRFLRLICACTLGLGLGLMSGAVPLAAAQTAAEPQAKQADEQKDEQKEEQKDDKTPSDRAVRVIMGYAFAALPESVPKRNGEMVKLNREEPLKFMIPIEDARRIIRIASLSASADLCGLKDLEREHFANMMKYERIKHKWTSYQFIFIELLHATTGLIRTGSVQTGDEVKKQDDASKDVRSEYVCSPQERERVKAAIEADIKTFSSVQ